MALVEWKYAQQAIHRLTAYAEQHDISSIQSLLTECFSSLSILQHHLHPTYNLVRVRRNGHKQHFQHVSELSYVPRSLSKSRQRANTPGTTLFYASSCERRANNGAAFTDTEHGLRVALFETLSELRENFRHGFGRIDPTEDYPPPFRVRAKEPIDDIRITYGIWEATTDILLANVCPTKVFDQQRGTKILQDRLLSSGVITNPYANLGLIDFWNYMSDAFVAVGRDSSEANYYISSVAAEVLCTHRGFDGVYYPSVRCDGLGINTAITPSAADQKLRCTEVGVINVGAVDGALLITNKRRVALDDGRQSFDLATT
jgi:hypothetical protein